MAAPERPEAGVDAAEQVRAGVVRAGAAGRVRARAIRQRQAGAAARVRARAIRQRQVDAAERA
jgi:hypothetical protein